MDIQTELKAIQNKISNSESVVHQMEGLIKGIEERLQTSFGITDWDEACKVLSGMKERESQLTMSIERRIVRLQKTIKEYYDATAS